MNKRIIALVLLFVMLLPVSLSSCNKETEIEETAIKIYTLYTICEEGTTQEAIREVELALNRIIVYRLGIGVKLTMVTSDEYEKLVEDKYQEIEDYKAEQQRLKDELKNSSATVTSDDESTEPEDVITGDRFIDILVANLESGEEYVLDAPRLDIFLVRGFDNYIELVSGDMLAELDEKLASEAKLIKDKIYPTFLSAAKVTNSKGKQKTYGVPMNTVIGEYEYVVFDEELLNKYEIDAMTMNTLEDLEYYLRIIKENEPDVVPLANAFDSTYCTYLFADGFPAMVNDDGVVVNPYDDKQALNYYTYISRYRSLGYLGNDDSKRFAVKFIRGTFEDLEALEKQTGHSYVSAIHSYPVATNENTLQNLFCVSKYVVSNELTDVAKLLQLIETDSDVANILAYGVENEHYKLDDNNQVVRLENCGYNVSNTYIGNAFLTYTVAGENPDKWENFKTQNLDSAKGEEQAKSLGFAYYPQTVVDPDDKNTSYEEPDYIALITPIAEQYYSKIITGEAANIDYEATFNEITESVNASIIAEIEQKYEDDLIATYCRQIEAKYNSDEYKQSLMSAATDKALNDFVTTTFKNKVRNDLKKELAVDNPDLSDSELTKLANSIMTKDYLKEQVLVRVSATEIDNSVNKIIFNSINSAIKKEKDSLSENPDYVADLAVLLSSEECLNEIEEALSADNYYVYQDAFAAIINEKLKEFSADLRKELSDAIKKEYSSFINSMLKKFDYNDVEKRSATLYNKALDELISQDKIYKQIERSVTNEVKEEMPDAQTDDIKVEVDKRMTPEYKRQKLLELDLVTESQIKTAYNTVLAEHINKAVGFTSSTASTDDDSVDSDDPDAETPSEDEDFVVDDDSDYFELLFITRIKKQYYVFSPLPTGATG